jgi:hypothetical protein
MSDLLHGRCATCKNWEGDRVAVVAALAEAENKENFLSVPDTWADSWEYSGYCRTLAIEMAFGEFGHCGALEDPSPCGVFGCILYEREGGDE